MLIPVREVKLFRNTSGALLRCAALVSLACSTLPCVAADDRVSWPEHGGGRTNSHFVSSNQINKSNVGQLSIAWSYPTRNNASYVFNPIVLDNIMYVLARDTALVAIDAASGKEIWVHEGPAGIAQRKINYWEAKIGAWPSRFIVSFKKSTRLRASRSFPSATTDL